MLLMARGRWGPGYHGETMGCKGPQQAAARGRRPGPGVGEVDVSSGPGDAMGRPGPWAAKGTGA
jgi:hypothetical protein